VRIYVYSVGTVGGGGMGGVGVDSGAHGGAVAVEIKPGSRVTVMGGPYYAPCSDWSSMKMYRVRLETQARGGSKTAYISASEIDDDRGAMNVAPPGPVTTAVLA